MYRLILESLLGLKLEAGRLRFALCMPDDWDGYKVHYRYGKTVYHIAVTRTHAVGAEMSTMVDGVEQSDRAVALIDDHCEHSVEIRI